MKDLISVYSAEIAKLRDAFPVGATIRFYIMTGQRIPSTGEVFSHHIDMGVLGSGECYAHPTLRVKHDQAQPFSRLSFRNVTVNKVIGLIDSGQQT